MNIFKKNLQLLLVAIFVLAATVPATTLAFGIDVHGDDLGALRSRVVFINPAPVPQEPEVVENQLFNISSASTTATVFNGLNSSLFQVADRPARDNSSNVVSNPGTVYNANQIRIHSRSYRAINAPKYYNYRPIVVYPVYPTRLYKRTYYRNTYYRPVYRNSFRYRY